MEMYVTVDSTYGDRKWYEPVEYPNGGTPTDEQILAQSVAQFGGTTNDYLIYRTTDIDTINNLKLKKRFEGVISNSVVTSIDFSISNAKMYVTVDSSSGARKFILPVTYAEGNIPNNSQILKESVANFGGVESDYLIYKVSDQSIIERLQKYDEFTGVIVGGVVTTLNFTIEDSKKKIEATTDLPNNRIRRYLDGTFETMNVTVTVYNSDDTVDTTFNSTEYIDIFNTTGKRIPSEITFTNGVASFQFMPAHFGYYTFPAEKVRVGLNGNIRVRNQLRIQVYYKAV